MRSRMRMHIVLAGISAALVACNEAGDPIGAPDLSIAVVVDVAGLDLGDLNGRSQAVGINEAPAARLLQSFIHQVQGWIVAGQIPSEEGDDLIQLATNGLALIES